MKESKGVSWCVMSLLESLLSQKAKGFLFKMNVHLWKRVCGKQTNCKM